MRLLYTCNIRGDLALLPRLYTFMRGLRQQETLLLDLGMSCVPEVWHCAVTQGRSTLFVLDAMNYHAANVKGVLTPSSREKLAETAMLALVDDAHSHQQGEVCLSTGNLSDCPNYPVICMTPAESTHIEGNVLYLAAVEQGQVGVVMWDDDNITFEVQTMPAKTPADATIAGAVDFVESEARYYQKRHENN